MDATHMMTYRLPGFRFTSKSEKAECERVYSKFMHLLKHEGIDSARRYAEAEASTCMDAYATYQN